MNRYIINYTLSYINNKNLYKLLCLVKFTIDSHIMKFKRVKNMDYILLAENGDMFSIYCKSYKSIQYIKKKPLPARFGNYIYSTFGLYDNIAINIIKIYPSNIPDQTLYAAAKYGHLEIIKYLMDNIFNIILYKPELRIIYQNIYGYSIKYGHLHIIKWLSDKTDIKNFQIIVDSSKYGHLHIIKYYHKIFKKNYFASPMYDHCILTNIVINGDLRSIKWLHKNKLLGDSYDFSLINNAITTNNLKMCKYLYKNIPIKNLYEKSFIEEAIIYAKKCEFYSIASFLTKILKKLIANY